MNSPALELKRSFTSTILLQKFLLKIRIGTKGVFMGLRFGDVVVRSHQTIDSIYSLQRRLDKPIRWHES